MRLRADFHVHTHYSSDSSLPPEELVKRARELRLDIVGVADHGTRRGAFDTKRLARGNPLVLVGQETRTQEGEVMVFGIDQDLEQMKPLGQTCRKARALGGLIVIPHPFDRFRHGIGMTMKQVLEYIDAIEGFNPMCILDSFNTKAREFALQYEKAVIAGSDAHFSREIGRGVTILDCARNEKSVFEAVRKGRTEIEGSRTGLRERLASRILQKLKKQ